MNTQVDLESKFSDRKHNSKISGMKAISFFIALAFVTLGFTYYYTLKSSNIIDGINLDSLVKANSEKNNSRQSIQQDLEQSVSRVAALGFIQPRQEPINLSAPAFLEGTRVEQLLVKQRAKVEIGQVIAVLDNRDRLEAAFNQAQREVQVSQARLAQVKAGASKGEIQAQKARLQANQAELQGQIDTQKATIGNLKAQLVGQSNSQKTHIERLSAEANNATRECQRYTQLEKGGAVSASEKDNICLQQETSEKQLAEAKVTLVRINRTLQQQIREAEANLNRTIATLNKQIIESQESFKAVAEVRDVDVQVVQAELATAISNVKRTQAELDLAYVRSPINGQILKVNSWPGEIVDNNDGIVVLGDTSSMFVVAEVHETDIRKVKLGHKATISSSGITKDLTGIVAEVGLQIGTKDILGTDPVADADARVVEVKIRLDPEDSKLVTDLTNLQVNVIIETNNS